MTSPTDLVATTLVDVVRRDLLTNFAFSRSEAMPRLDGSAFS